MSQEIALAVNSPALKPGYLTTEFWGKLVLQLIGLLVVFGVIEPGQQEHAGTVALGLITALEAAYGLARGLAKNAAARPNPVFRTGSLALFAAPFLALTGPGARAQALPDYYIRPTIGAVPTLAPEGLPVSITFRATTPVEIYWVKITGSAYEEQVAARGSFVFIPPAPGTYLVVVQTRDTLSPIYVAETRRGWCWDGASNAFQYRRGGYVATNAPEGQPQYTYNGAGWESDWRWFTVTPQAFAGIAN